MLDDEPLDPPARRLELVFVLRNLAGYLRFFGGPIEALLSRGHSVRLLLEEPRHGPVQQAWLDEMALRPGFSHEIADHFDDSRWNAPGRAIRQSLSFIRFLEPDFEAYPAYQYRSGRRAPDFIKRLTAPRLVRSRVGLRLLHAVFDVLDRAAPRPPAPAEYLRRHSPDLLALCDYGHAGSLHSAYVEAARAQGIPAAICVASWDNLSTRQLIRAEPDLLVVWNDRQVQEAVEIHGIPAERVVTTGAQCFDHWFTWKPRPRDEFCARVGLDPGRPYVLWVGSALNPSAVPEPEYVLGWARGLRGSASPALRELGVLLRPHPKRFEEWIGTDFSEVPHVAVWPRDEMTMPTDRESRADYFDSIHHSVAVTGINSSAMIEAAIVGRPVLALHPPEFRDSHEGTFHFAYIDEAQGGVVRAVASRAEHDAELERLLGGVDPERIDRTSRFIREFVRPHGLERSATSVFVATLERLADTPTSPPAQPAWLGPARAALGAAIRAGQIAGRLRRLAIRIVFALRLRFRRLTARGTA